jgi:hypothetical protein
MVPLTRAAGHTLASEGAPATSPQEQVTTTPPECELSVVMPCLNEADTIATCITKALQAI